MNMEIFKIKSARKRRLKILGSTSKEKNVKGRYTQAYNKVNYVAKNSKNSLTRLKAVKDAEYFKRKLGRYS